MTRGDGFTGQLPADGRMIVVLALDDVAERMLPRRLATPAGGGAGLLI